VRYHTLFKFAQITLAGNNRLVSKLDKTIFSLFEKDRVLELLSSFIIFDNKVKKIARYQQYFAIKEIVKKIDKSVISRHIRNIFKENELDENSVVAKNATTSCKKAIFEPTFSY